MFYVKSKLAEGVTIWAEITDENVFIICPDCGTEHQIVLADITSEDDSAICCDACAEKYLRPKEQTEGRELHFDRWEPDERQYRRLMAYFIRNYEGCRDNYGADDEQTVAAFALYKKVRYSSLRSIKEKIQEHFAEMFSLAGGHPEAVYDQELCDFINLTVCPDPPGKEA